MLTKRQTQALAFIERYTAKCGHAPTYQEIGKALGVSSLATVHKHVHNLQALGMLSREPNRARQITLSGCCPLCGNVR